MVGIGPGHEPGLTLEARLVLEQAEVVAGYHTYLELVTDLIADKEVIGSGMMQEVERCEAAVEQAKAGKRVAVISSGDPGIYGMAGLVFGTCGQASGDDAAQSQDHSRSQRRWIRRRCFRGAADA